MTNNIQEIWTAKQEEKLRELGKAFDNTAELYRKITLLEHRVTELESELIQRDNRVVQLEVQLRACQPYLPQIGVDYP